LKPALAALVLGTALAARAQTFETQHGFDTTFQPRSRWEVTLHGRIRTQPRGSGLYQARGGPIVEYEVNRRVGILGGYFFSRQEAAGGWLSTHRPFGGVEATAFSRRRFDADARVMAERFMPQEGRDFARYRERIRARAKGPAAPYASVEWFQDRQGLRSIRYAAGLRFRPRDRVTVDVGYFYERRPERLGGDRHMLLTTFHLLRPGRRPDADI
jgi:hypothetical protein